MQKRLAGMGKWSWKDAGLAVSRRVGWTYFMFDWIRVTLLLGPLHYHFMRHYHWRNRVNGTWYGIPVISYNCLQTYDYLKIRRLIKNNNNKSISMWICNFCHRRSEAPSPKTQSFQHRDSSLCVPESLGYLGTVLSCCWWTSRKPTITPGPQMNIRCQ